MSTHRDTRRNASLHRGTSAVVAFVLCVAVGSASAQTRIVPPPNKYKPADDVKLGQEAAQQAQQVARLPRPLGAVGLQVWHDERDE